MAPNSYDGMPMRKIAQVLLLLSSTLVWAGPKCDDLFKNPHLVVPSLFGPEFTFSNTDLQKGATGATKAHYEENGQKLVELKAFYEKLCMTRGCKIVEGRDKHGPTFKVSYGDGWYFTVAVDYAVIEVQTKASSYRDFLKHKTLLKIDLFNIMKRFGLGPHESFGGGHIHIDLAAFGNNSKLFRNFFVDFTNHHLVTYGVLGKDVNNAPPLVALKDYQRQAFIDLLAIYDENPTMSIKTFAATLDREVYKETYANDPDWQKHNTHYQALKVSRINDPFIEMNQKTIEIRGIRPQKDIDTFILQMELFLARIEYLKTRTDFIEYKPEKYKEATAQDAVDSFYDYVTQAGLGWEKFKVLLPKNLEGITPSKEKANEESRGNENTMGAINRIKNWLSSSGRDE